MKNVKTSAFYGHIYHAALMFTSEDFYLPVLESLTNAKKNNSQESISKLNKAMLLLDVHIY